MKAALGAIFLTWGIATAAVPERVGTEPDFPQAPYTVESLSRWHRAMQPWPWTFASEEQVRLHGNGAHQRLLCFGGGARSGEFALFAKRHGSWREIGKINQAHHPIRVLPHQVAGWHDFQTFVPLWGSGDEEVAVFHYRWVGHGYAEHSVSKGKFCDYEPFKSNAGLCTAQ